MSFFIRKRKSGSALPRKLTDRAGGVQRNQGNHRGGRGGRGRGGHGRPHKIPKLQKRPDDDEITSEEDDEDDGAVVDQEAEHDDSDSSSETEQQARLRLARREIEEIREKEGDEDIEGALKLKVLQDEGRVVRRVADELVASDLCGVDVCVGGKAMKSPITSLAVQGDHAYVSCKNGVIIRINLQDKSRTTTPQPIRKRKQKPSKSRITPIQSLAVSPTVLAASSPNSITLYCPDTLKLLHEFRTRDPGPIAMSGDTLFSCHKDRTIKVWSTREHAFVEALFGHQDVPTCVDTVVVGDEVRCVSGGGFDRTVRVWKLSSESQLVYAWDEDIIDCVRVVSGGLFVAGGCSGSISVFSFNRKKPLVTVPKAHGVDENGVASWVCSLGGLYGTDLLCSGGSRGEVRVWKIGVRGAALELLRVLECGGLGSLSDGSMRGIVVGLSVTGDLGIVAAVSVEHAKGRWGGREGKRNKVVVFRPRNSGDGG